MNRDKGPLPIVVLTLLTLIGQQISFALSQTAASPPVGEEGPHHTDTKVYSINLDPKVSNYDFFSSAFSQESLKRTNNNITKLQSLLSNGQKSLERKMKCYVDPKHKLFKVFSHLMQKSANGEPEMDATLVLVGDTTNGDGLPTEGVRADLFLESETWRTDSRELRNRTQSTDADLGTKPGGVIRVDQRRLHFERSRASNSLGGWNMTEKDNEITVCGKVDPVYISGPSARDNRDYLPLCCISRENIERETDAKSEEALKTKQKAFEGGAGLKKEDLTVVYPDQGFACQLNGNADRSINKDFIFKQRDDGKIAIASSEKSAGRRFEKDENGEIPPLAPDTAFHELKEDGNYWRASGRHAMPPESSANDFNESIELTKVAATDQIALKWKIISGPPPKETIWSCLSYAPIPKNLR